MSTALSAFCEQGCSQVHVTRQRHVVETLQRVWKRTNGLRERNNSFSSQFVVVHMTDLFKEILKSGAKLRVKVTGSSMTPFLCTGEVVTIKAVPSGSLRLGDLIFFKGHEEKLCLHRIVKKREVDQRLVFQTKGDARRSFDLPVSHENILGKVHEIEKVSPFTRSTYLLNLESSVWKRINYIIAKVQVVGMFGYYGGLRFYKAFRKFM